MIEENLLQYGILGLWTISLLYERYKFQKEMKKLIENNTKFLTLNEAILNKINQKISTK